MGGMWKRYCIPARDLVKTRVKGCLLRKPAGCKLTSNVAGQYACRQANDRVCLATADAGVTALSVMLASKPSQLR